MAERKLTYHSGEKLELEEGGCLLLSRYLTESGGIRTVVQVPRDADVPIPALTDRDVGVLCGLLLSFVFAPAVEPVPILDVDAAQDGSSREAY